MRDRSAPSTIRLEAYVLRSSKVQRDQNQAGLGQKMKKQQLNFDSPTSQSPKRRSKKRKGSSILTDVSKCQSTKPSGQVEHNKNEASLAEKTPNDQLNMDSSVSQTSPEKSSVQSKGSPISSDVSKYQSTRGYGQVEYNKEPENSVPNVNKTLLNYQRPVVTTPKVEQPPTIISSSESQNNKQQPNRQPPCTEETGTQSSLVHQSGQYRPMQYCIGLNEKPMDLRLNVNLPTMERPSTIGPSVVQNNIQKACHPIIQSPLEQQPGIYWNYQEGNVPWNTLTSNNNYVKHTLEESSNMQNYNVQPSLAQLPSHPLRMQQQFPNAPYVQLSDQSAKYFSDEQLLQFNKQVKCYNRLQGHSFKQQSHPQSLPKCPFQQELSDWSDPNQGRKWLLEHGYQSQPTDNQRDDQGRHQQNYGNAKRRKEKLSQME